MAVDKLVAGYEALKKLWAAKKIAEVGKLLEELKLALIETSFLPTSTDVSEKELFITREILEIGAQHSVAAHDVAAFERYMAILKTYYTDHSGRLPQESPKMYELYGLNLLCLLSQNHTAEFHTELELLPASTLQENPYIACPVRLEQFIMEGSYNKVIDLKHNVPAESYAFFINILLNTIRDEIASCMEKAYESISVKECEKMLSLEKKDLQNMVNTRGWSIEKNVVLFQPLKDKKPLLDVEVPAKELAEMAITYAKEMEQIV